MLRLHSILVPLDLADPMASALSVARSLARDHQAKLILVNCPATPPYTTAEVMVPSADYAGILAEAQRSLDAVAQTIQDIPVETQVVMAEPGPGIVSLAEKDQADLIVMATHGRSGLGRVLMGSVAEYVLRHAPCPVLTIKPATAGTWVDQPESNPALVMASP